jgi:hypothetical protein
MSLSRLEILPISVCEMIDSWADGEEEETFFLFGQPTRPLIVGKETTVSVAHDN